MKHDAESHVGDRDFKGKDEGIPLDEKAAAGPLDSAAVARTADGLTHVNTLVHDPYGWTLTSPSMDLPARGPCAEEGTSKKTAVAKDDPINAAKEEFVPGTFPRNVTFPSDNIFTITSEPRMPEISVTCEAHGFQPTEIFWRLQVRHVLGRHFSTGSYLYKTICRPLALEWRGKSTSLEFTLFAADEDDSVSYDEDANDRDDVVMGGYAVLSVATYPPGETKPLICHAHLRIRGTNPSADEVKDFLGELLEDRHQNILLMAQAAFIHESGLKQFSDKAQWRTKFVINRKRHAQIRKGQLKAHPHATPATDADQPDCSLPFIWPYDPPGFPKVAFDFGVGISQFTQLSSQTVTEAIAWNWKENVIVGVNLLLRKLAIPFAPPKKNKTKKKTKKGAKPPEPPPTTWIDWAMIGWKLYNGSKPYAVRLRKTKEAATIAETKTELRTEDALSYLMPIPQQKTKGPTTPWPR